MIFLKGSRFEIAGRMPSGVRDTLLMRATMAYMACNV